MENARLGKKITLFLIDGIPNGRIFVELSNWIGKAYKLPRTMVIRSNDRDDLAGTGVYLLFGKDPEDNSKDMVYIGETEEVYKRLRFHLEKKEFWNYAVVVVSKDNNLNKAHLKYLESKMLDVASRIGRYKIDNANRPKYPAISEPDTAEMEEYFANLALLVSTLGLKVFDEVKQSPVDASPDIGNSFFIKAARGADAQGQPTAEGFVVLKGSQAAIDEAESFKGANFQSFYNLRQQLIRDKIIKSEEGKLIFSQDVLFSSPSTAAMIVMGRSANGRTEWKTENGKQLKDVEQGL